MLFEEKVFPKCQTSKDSHGDIPIWDDEPDFPNFNTPLGQPPSDESDESNDGFRSLEELKH